MGEQDGPEYLSVGDEPELKVIYATVHHIIESGCLMPWEEISQRRLMVSTNLDLIMIHASEKAYCKKLQAYQKDHNVTRAARHARKSILLERKIVAQRRAPFLLLL